MVNRIIRPASATKFNVSKQAFKEKITLQIEDIRKKKQIKTYDKKIKNIKLLNYFKR